MIDLHAHILPGLDDGPNTLEKAVEMARVAVAGGTTVMVASPHAFDRVYFNDRDGVRAGVVALQAELDRHNVPLQILPAMENRVHPDLLERYRMGEVQTINDSRYILIEFSYSQMPLYSEHVLFSLLAEGLVPVLVHPERTKSIQADPNILGRLVERGVLALLSADCLESGVSRDMQKTVQTLITHHLVHGVASDAHNSRRRPPGIREAYETMGRILKEKHLPDWLKELPEQIIQNRAVVCPEPMPVRERRSFFHFR